MRVDGDASAGIGPGATIRVGATSGATPTAVAAREAGAPSCGSLGASLSGTTVGMSAFGGGAFGADPSEETGEGGTGDDDDEKEKRSDDGGRSGSGGAARANGGGSPRVSASTSRFIVAASG